MLELEGHERGKHPVSLPGLSHVDHLISSPREVHLNQLHFTFQLCPLAVHEPCFGHGSSMVESSAILDNVPAHENCQENC